jgi:predicted nucleotidyltransferase
MTGGRTRTTDGFIWAMRREVEVEVAVRALVPGEYIGRRRTNARGRKSSGSALRTIGLLDIPTAASRCYSPSVATLDTVRSRADEIRAIAAAHGARNVRVVGSVARGTEREDSDIDLLVTFDPGVGLLEHARLVLELERLLGRKVDVASERGVRPAVRRNLEADAKAL